MRSPEPQPSAASAVVLTVDDWAGTFQVPVGVERRFEPGPRWLVPTAGVIGLVLAVVLISPGPPSPIAWLGVPLFLASVVAMALNLGGARGMTAGMAAATLGWLALVAAVLGTDRLDKRLAIALLALGVLGQIVAAERLRTRSLRDGDCIVAARRGARTDGWVVRVDGPPWERRLGVEASGDAGGPWTGSQAGWQALRPGVGHPVGIWQGEAGRAVVLLPRPPR